MNMTMDPDIKSKWVADLTSGEYKQGRRWLRDKGDQYCCLGVLCDQYSRATGKPWVRDCDAPIYKFMGALSSLPGEVAAWAGVARDCEASVWLDAGRSDSLASLNDQGMPFAEIAKLIEEQL